MTIDWFRLCHVLLSLLPFLSFHHRLYRDIRVKGVQKYICWKRKTRGNVVLGSIVHGHRDNVGRPRRYCLPKTDPYHLRQVAVTRKHLLTMQQVLDYPILLHTIPEVVLVGL